MNSKNSFFRNISFFVLIPFFACFVAVGQPGEAQAGTGDVLFGVASSQVFIDPGSIDTSNFYDYFTNEGETSPSLTIGGDIGAQIGAIWTGGSSGDWREIRIVVDSNGDGKLVPFNWSDSSHPWNRPDNGTPDDFDDDPTEWIYEYPSDYPDEALSGQTITLTWSEDCWCVDDFPWDTFQFWHYESGFDKTDCWWMEKGQLMNMWWEGRDQDWNTLPNDEYKVQVWVDEDQDMEFESTEANKLMVIKIATSSISGTVVDEDDNPVQGARVEAGSHMAWGETRTDADGEFTISGLKSDASYYVCVQADGKVTAELHEIEIPTGQTSVTISNSIVLMDAIAITGTLELDQNANGTGGEEADRFVPFSNQWGWVQTDLWVWIDAWNMQGPGWGNTDARFEYPMESVVYNEEDWSIESYTEGLGNHTTTFTINIEPPEGTAVYNINVHADGYAAPSKTVEVDADGGTAGTIILTKASILTGTVKLPSAITGWRHIDVQAVDTTDSDNRYWGWGQIDPYRNSGDTPDESEPSTDTGEFRIDGILEGTYNIEIRVQGHIPYLLQNVAVVQGEDKNVGQLIISKGNAISGTFTIQGDTTGLMTHWGDSGTGSLYIGLDVWGHSGGSWIDLTVPRGADKSVTYEIGGLGNSTYEVNAWIGEGYELVDENSNAPVIVSLSGDTTLNLILKPFEGIVTGTITGPAALDLSKVIVEVKRPWDWLPPKIATVANGKINANTGVYTVSGLGTGDYVVKAGMYDGYSDMFGQMSGDLTGYNGEGFMMPNSAVGIALQRTFVVNDADNPTTLNIAMERGYSISGLVSLSTTDPPWHDFGDGTWDETPAGGEGDLGGGEGDFGGGEGKYGDFTFGGSSPAGDTNGKKDLDDDLELSEAVSMSMDVVGQSVFAMPMDMMFMGGEDPRMGQIEDDGTYQINGLASGVYIMMPPFNSWRISQIVASTQEPSDYDHGFQGGQEDHHWTVTSQMVIVSGDDVTDKNFTLANGYTVSGRITMPEAQTYTEEWEAWDFVGHLELETSTRQFMGHGEPLMKSDFENSNRYEFIFDHVANGEYMVRFWTDRYVPGTATFSVSNANASVNLTIEAGANLIGKLVDADTGEAVTSGDGVMVVCEAFPHVEGSWRETRDDQWSQSYIEDGAALMNSGGGTSGGSEEGERDNNIPGKFHLTAIPTGHTYVIWVETTNGRKTGGAKNYVGKVISGITVPDGASGDIDVGTISLKEGTTIQGRLTDINGTPIPGVEVFAIPSSTHDGTAEAEGMSDTQGYYTVFGIDPDVQYYDLIVAERPFMFEEWGKQVEWGEKRKYNVTPETTDADFVLALATATLSGTLTIPEAADFAMPFKDQGFSFPAAHILMQKKGIIYRDILDGIEGMSAPAPTDVTSSTYTIDNIEPGKYKITFMNYGLPTEVVDNVVIADGSNTLDLTWDSVGYAISGACALATGGYPGSSDISGVICMNTANQSINFGSLTQEADGSYSAYEVPGLGEGETYRLTFFKESGMDETPDIFPVGVPFTVTGDITDNTATIDRNQEPILMYQAVQGDDANTIYIGIFSTSYLVDREIEIVDIEPEETAVNGEVGVAIGDGILSDAILSGSKKNITLTYTKASTDSDVTLSLTVHYGDDATAVEADIGFNVNTVVTNNNIVNVYMAQCIKLGNGDASQIYIPPGALAVDSVDGKALVSIEKSAVEPGAALSLVRGAKIDTKKLGKFAKSARTALPSGVTAAGNQYDFDVSAVTTGASVTQNATVTIQLEYDPSLVSDATELNIWHLEEGATEWTAETTNRTLDTDNNTISAEVSSLSPFIAAVGDTGDGSGGSGGSSSSSGGGGGCFIATAHHAVTADILSHVLSVLCGIAVLRFAYRKKNLI